ncbi:MAG TPA: tripartite tricarboxylate transporter TctB family protein [Nocardioidaceae bacterium]|nr:tripartite tricarboxylate transporter TctB family protein [Nocardioidaceae bacterium]
MRADLVAGSVLLLVAALFWVQRDYRPGGMAGTFPDVVLITLVVSGVWIILRGIVSGDRTHRPREVNLRILAAAGALLVGWALGMGLIGFTISSVVAFVAMATLIRRARPRPKTLAVDTLVAVAVVVVCFVIFTRVLLVPLPVSTLIGM